MKPDYSGDFVTDYGNETSQDVAISCRNGIISYTPTMEVHTSSYRSSTTDDDHTLRNEFHLNSMTLQISKIY